jgi:hypothetical protein
MTTDSLSLDRPRRFHFDWLLPALFRPRPTLARVADQTNDTWLTPLLVLMLTALIHVAVAGPLRQAAAQSGQNLPDAAQWWTPEQLQQYLQIQSSMTGPVFIYVFPALLGVLGIWVGWLILVGLLHLVLTLIGGRGSTRVAMNVVAWASLPFAVRDIVQIADMLIERKLLLGAGISGFVPNDGTTMSFILAAVLALIDFYLCWHIFLLMVGVRVSTALPLGKAIGGVAITMLIWLGLQALPTFLGSQFGALGIIQPFF